eukprot:500447_1
MSAEYNLPLAIYDYAPVFLFVIGYGTLFELVYKYINKLIASSICIGIILTFIGGFLKATHKVVISTTKKDILWMDRGMFVWQSAGFLFITYSIICLYKQQSAKSFLKSMDTNIIIIKYYLYPIVIVIPMELIPLIFGLSVKTAQWRFIPMVFMIILNIIGCVYLLIYVYKIRKLKCVAALILIHLLGIIALGGLGNQSRTIAIQWVQQSMNTIVWIIFIIAMFLLRKDVIQNDLNETTHLSIESADTMQMT